MSDHTSNHSLRTFSALRRGGIILPSVLLISVTLPVGPAQGGHGWNRHRDAPPVDMVVQNDEPAPSESVEGHGEVPADEDLEPGTPPSNQQPQPTPQAEEEQETVGYPEEELRGIVARQLERVQELVSEASRISFDPISLSTEVAAHRLPSGRAQAALAFVRNHITFEPYSGRVRGARGALFSHSANAVDASLLLAALLEHQGIAWRLVRAELDDEQATRLVASALPSAGLTGEDQSGRLYQPGSHRWRRRTVAQHWWVEAQVDSEWFALDAVYPDLDAGEAVAEPLARYAPGEIPQEFLQSVTVRLQYHREFRPTVTALTYTADMVDLSYRNVVLSFYRVNPHVRQPTLEFATEVIQGDPIDLREADEMWIELEFGMGRSAYRVRRDLRQGQEPIDLFAGDLQVFSVLFLPGWIGPDYYAAVSGAQLRQIGESSTALVEQAQLAPTRATGHTTSTAIANALQPILSSATGLAGLTLAYRSDEIALSLASQLGVRPYFARPRIIIVGAIQQFDEVAFQMDLRDDGIETIPFQGVPVGIPAGFQTLRGRIDSELAGEVLDQLTGLPTLTASQILCDARALEIPFLSMSPGERTILRRFSVPEFVKNRMEQDTASAGGVVIAPQQPVLLSGSERTAWWLALAADGSLIGVLDNGIRGAVSGFLAQNRVTLPTHRPGLSVVKNTLEWALTLLAAAIDQATPRQHPRPDICAMLCDLEQTSAAACGDPSLATLARCLGGESTGDDPLGLGLRCQDMVETFRCGVVISCAVLTGEARIEVNDDALFSGPFDRAIEPLILSDCDCGP